MSILVAEDNYANQLLVKTILSRAGHKVTIVSDGNEAVAACRIDQYDLILMDIEMPQTNGIEATEILRTTVGINQSTPIIALTAYGSASEKYTYRHSGIDDVISKPFKLQDLNQILSNGLPSELNPSGTGFPPLGASPSSANIQDATQLQLLDRITLDCLLENAGSENLGPIVKAFWRSAYALLSDMQSAQEIWDRESLQKAAHGLKGASANLGLLQISHISAQLQNSKPDATTAYLEALDLSMTRSRKALAVYLENY